MAGPDKSADKGADQAPEKAQAPRTVRVRALGKGFYGGLLRSRGDTFEIRVDEDLGGWMEPIAKEDRDRLAPKLKAFADKRMVPAPPIGPNVKPTPGVRLV